jgi:hypothetical protein
VKRAIRALGGVVTITNVSRTSPPLDGLRGEMSIAELRRREGIAARYGSYLRPSSACASPGGCP